MQKALFSILAILAVGLLMAAALLACAVESTPETLESTVETAIATQRPAPSPTAEPTLTQAATPSPTAELTSTQAPTVTPVVETTPTHAPTATLTQSPTAMPTAQSTPTQAPTATPTQSSVATPTAQTTPTQAPTATPTQSSAATPTAQTTPTQVPTATPVVESVELSLLESEIPIELPEYDRDDWRHWTDEDRDCQNTRHEVLVAESLIDVTFKNEDECQVETGEWFGAFTATTVTEASKLDVDHLVPLANAHRSGAWNWTSERRRSYANSLDDPRHLIAVTARANRSKGAKGPEEWQPENESYRCQYATDWIVVKQTWELTVTRAESVALQSMLETCANPPVLDYHRDGDLPRTLPVLPQPLPQALPTVLATKQSRLASSGSRAVSGSGRGFPASMVPSARDGDGDGSSLREVRTLFARTRTKAPVRTRAEMSSKVSDRFDHRLALLAASGPQLGTGSLAAPNREQSGAQRACAAPARLEVSRRCELITNRSPA